MQSWDEIEEATRFYLIRVMTATITNHKSTTSKPNKTKSTTSTTVITTPVNNNARTDHQRQGKRVNDGRWTMDKPVGVLMLIRTLPSVVKVVALSSCPVVDWYAVPTRPEKPFGVALHSSAGKQTFDVTNDLRGSIAFVVYRCLSSPFPTFPPCTCPHLHKPTVPQSAGPDPVHGLVRPVRVPR